MNVHRVSRYGIALASLLAPIAVHGQGFGLNEIGSCAVGRASATAATGCRDASAIFWNPAAIASLQGTSAMLGVAAIAVQGDFTQDTTLNRYKSDVPVEFPPHLFWAVHRPASKWAYGVGVYVPYGLTSQWGDEFPGRFSAKKASLQTIYGQPTIAYKVNDRWSVGGGPIIGHSSVELIQGIDLADQIASATVVPRPGLPDTVIYTRFSQLGIPSGTEFARATLKGDAWGYGFQVGLQGKLNSSWTFGARFLSKITFKYDDADATFQQRTTGLVLGGAIPDPTNPTGPPAIPAGTPVDQIPALVAAFQSGGTLASQKVNTSINHPAQLQAGFSYTGFAGTEVSFDYEWIGWKTFKDLPVDFQGPAPDRTLIEDYNNSSVLRVGADRQMGGWTLRGGFSAATSAAPKETVTPLLPEQDRYTLNIGAGLPLGQKWALDAAYGYVGVWGARGRIIERTSRDQTADELNTGFYRLRAHLFSISLKASY